MSIGYENILAAQKSGYSIMNGQAAGQYNPQ